MSTSFERFLNLNYLKPKMNTRHQIRLGLQREIPFHITNHNSTFSSSHIISQQMYDPNNKSKLLRFSIAGSSSTPLISDLFWPPSSVSHCRCYPLNVAGSHSNAARYCSNVMFYVTLTSY